MRTVAGRIEARADDVGCDLEDDAEACLDAATIDATTIPDATDCVKLKEYLVDLAARIAAEELEGRPVEDLQPQYDALFVVYRRHC
jgi:hypothetical protein